MADLNFAEGIHYLVTRPVVPIVDDGQGNFNISPIGFPVRNVSGERNQNPTRITPDFVMGYNNVVDGSSRLVVDYTEYNANIPSLSGLYTFIIGVTSITRNGSTVTVTTSADHGYVTGKTITIAGALQTDYNGSYTITVTASNEFTYTIATTPVTPATGSITSRYTAEENGLVYLTSQTNPAQNGYYVTRSIVWADLYLASTSNKDIRVKTNNNIDISTGGLSTVTYNIESIESVTLGTGKVFAVVTTTDENGFATGNSITIAGATVTGYNGTFDIEKLTGSSFRYEIPSALASDATGTAEYEILENDLVYAAAQTDGDENALYIAHSASSWELYGFFYEWDGTENDNVAGEYGDDVDVDGYPLNHYRKGYSLEETADFLKEKLEVQLEFGQFKGSQHNRSDHGAFVRWLLSGRQVNIGHSGKDKNVFIDGFGLGNPESVKASDRTNGTVDPYDADAVAAKKALIAQENKYTIWGLTNHHSNSLTGYFNKSPYLKDYPRIYNSEYENESPFGYLTGGHLPVDTDVERWRMTVTGTATSTDTEVRPIMIDTLWYHRDNAYHNNITLDMKNSAMVGRHSLSIVNNFNVPDRIALIGQALADTDITVGSPGTITVPEVSPWYEGDYVQFRVEDGNTLPSGLAEYTTYKVAPGYPSGSDIQLTDLSGTPINLSDTGSGNFIIERHVFDPYNNDEVIDSLDDIAGITLNSGLSIVYPVTVGTVTNYYINPRKKGSLTDIVPKGSWTPSSLSWDAAGLNGINIYLNAAETDYVTFTHPTMLTADLLEELNQHNDMIPVPFDPVNTDIDSLTSIFVDNSLIDYTDNINRSNKIRSKKTFVHLPAPIELHDGAKIELDVSLPVIPETDSFPFNTLGSLSGYRNYVTQPRVYVLGGYQAFACENFTISSLTQTGGLATMVLASDHGRYTSTFTDSDVDVDLDSIRISNWKDVSVGDIVRFKNTAGALPTPLAITTDYIVTSIVRDTITLSDDLGSAIDITSAAGGGTHSIVIQSPVRFSLRESTDSYYNDEFDGYVYDFDTIQFNVDENAASPAPGPIILDRTITTSGANDVRGLTERSNASVFSPMPEVEFAEDGNVYNQTFTPDNLVGNGLVGDDRDIRTLLATVYPTATSTFAWRMDNSPRIRMLKWSLMNVHALGGVADTGSFANVAYKRNKEIVNEFAFLFKNGSDGVMSVYDNPLSYVDTTEPSYTQQEVNAFVRIRYQSTLAPRVLTDLLSEEDVATVGSFNYQAADAYNELLSDFYKGRVLVNSNNGNLNEYDASLPINHSGVTDIPSSFFDHTASSKFLDFTSIEGMYSGADYEAYARWYAKNIYAPRYIVNAQGYTALDAYDAYKNVDQTLKDDINDYYYDTNERDSSANNRYVVDHLEPLIDAEFEFGAGSDNKLVNYLISNEASDLNLNDLRRRLWDSHFNIPDASDRQIQNAFHMSVTSPSIEDSAKFYGASWIPFAKIFSSDNVSPSENAIDDILDYATIIGGTYPAHNNTLDNAIASNLIAERYKELGYVDAFASVNTEDTTNSDREEFLRNYVSGYANRLPYRLYNGFKIAVAGRDDSDAYATDTSNILVDTETDIERIYTYSIKDYLNGYITTPSADVARYLNDNFVISELSIADTNVYAHDLNPSWWYFENGNPSSDPENSKIKDMINVSGMNHIADREFYINKMKYNYTRVKMSFMFSKKLGRWLPLDYRQAPTSYLTPTFGATALKQTERSIISAGSTGKSVTDYINYLQPDVSNVFSASQYGGNKLNCVMLTPFSVGDTIAIYDKDSVNSITAVIASVSTSALPYTSSLLCFYTLTEDLPEIYQLQSKLNISAPINTIDSAQYPINLLTGIESRDYLWKNPICLDPANMYKQLNLIAYWEMQPMILNRACYPFLSTEFPYNNDGELVPELDHTYDPASAENYRFTRLIEPNLASPDGINFVVPNNVHGGTIDPDNSLMLYQPHMWKVYWHMRPSVCAMEGTDIPSPTERTGGVMADPVLNSIYCFPDARDPQYTIPWHDDMGRDWLNSGWLLIDARIDDVDTNPERDLYFEIDAQIVEPDEERDDFWEIESADIPAAERQAAIDDLE